MIIHHDIVNIYFDKVRRDEMGVDEVYSKW